MANRFHFRAWDKKNQHMFYDGYNCWEDTHITTHDYLGLSLGGDIYRQWEYVDNAPELANLTEKATDEYILMQSTGLTDKNGKEIYEGDIVVDVKDKTKYKVFYREIGACFSLEFLDSKNFDCRDFGEIQYEGIEQNLEIIGNIYENEEE